MTTTEFNARIDKMMGHVDNARVTAAKNALKSAFSTIRTEVTAGLNATAAPRALHDLGERICGAAEDLASNLRGAS